MSDCQEPSFDFVAPCLNANGELDMESFAYIA